MIDIDSLIKQSMKSKNMIELNAYKNIKVEIQKNQTAKGAKPLTDSSQLSIIQKYAKSLEDAIRQFSEAGRGDLVASYTSELEVVQKLLPAPVDESEICSEVINWAESNGFGFMLSTDNPIQIPKKEMGKAIKYLKSEFPTADGRLISDIVKKYVI